MKKEVATAWLPPLIFSESCDFLSLSRSLFCRSFLSSRCFLSRSSLFSDRSFLYGGSLNSGLFHDGSLFSGGFCLSFSGSHRSGSLLVGDLLRNRFVYFLFSL